MARQIGDIAREARRGAPGASSVVHLNAAGAGLLSQAVVDAIKSQLDREARRGTHWAMADGQAQLDETRRLAARLFGVPATHLAFGESASRLWALAFASINLPPKARILVARNDWGGNILSILRRAATGSVDIVRLPMNQDGLIDIDAARPLIDERTAAICVSAVASSFGLRQPVQELGALVRPETCLYFVDVSQAVGQMPIDGFSTSADVMVAPARKWLRGGRGQAMLGLSDRALGAMCQPALIDQSGVRWHASDKVSVRDDARRFETWEFSAAARLGLRTALLELSEISVDIVRKVIAGHLEHLRRILGDIDGIEIFEPADRTAAAFLTFRHRTIPAWVIVDGLADRNVAIASVGLDYARWELEARDLEAIARVAPHITTDADDIERFGLALRGVLASLGGVRKSRRRASKA